MKRTLKNCGIMRKHGQAEVVAGKCLGFGKSETDDEPCEACKTCKLSSSYEEVSHE